MSREQQIINERKRKLEELRKKGVNHYPSKFDKKHTCQQALKSKIGTRVKTAGRVVTKRDLGKIIFTLVEKLIWKKSRGLFDNDTR